MALFQETAKETKVDFVELKPEQTYNMTALIDADTIAYAVCSVCEMGDDETGYTIDLDYALEIANERIDTILKATGCGEAELHFTRGKNFRYALDSGYKDNRSTTRIPEGLGELKELLNKNYSGLVNTDFEADDMVCMLKREYPEKYVLVAVDKDVLFGVAGTHFNYFQRAEGKNRYGTVLKEIKMKWVKTTEKDALAWSYMQALMGDSGDGIKGIPKCGPVKAVKTLFPEIAKEVNEAKKEFKKRTEKDAKLFDDLIHKDNMLKDVELTEEILWERLSKAYKDNGLDDKQAILNMRLVNMHQVTKERELCLWTQPTM